jgi:putative transposase
MACERTSISGFCKEHEGLPSHTTLLKILHRLNMAELVQYASAMLCEAAKGVITPGQTYTFAIDKTSDPYYGKKSKEPGSYTVGGKRKASTNYFYTYLTLSIIDKGRHITLLVLPCQKGTDNLTLIQSCIDLITAYGLNIRCLCIDREFYAAEIFSYLQQAGIPHIVPVKASGEELKEKLKGKKSNTFTYTLNATKPNAVTVTITDCLVYLKGKGGKHGLRHHAFVVYGIVPSPKKIRAIYKHRFAIESTYRLRNTTKPRTSSRDPVLRYYYTLVAFLCQNQWIHVKWNYFARIQRGPKVIEGDRFPLAHFATIVRMEALPKFKIRTVLDSAIS